LRHGDHGYSVRSSQAPSLRARRRRTAASTFPSLCVARRLGRCGRPPALPENGLGAARAESLFGERERRIGYLEIGGDTGTHKDLLVSIYDDGVDALRPGESHALLSAQSENCRRQAVRIESFSRHDRYRHKPVVHGIASLRIEYMMITLAVLEEIALVCTRCGHRPVRQARDAEISAFVRRKRILQT